MESADTEDKSSNQCTQRELRKGEERGGGGGERGRGEEERKFPAKGDEEERERNTSQSIEGRKTRRRVPRRECREKKSQVKRGEKRGKFAVKGWEEREGIPNEQKERDQGKV